MLSVTNHRELQAAALAFKAANRDLRKNINAATRDTMNPVWRSLLEQHAGRTPGVGGRLINTGVRIAAGNPPQAKAAQSKRAIGRQRRLVPATDWPWYEFGTKNPQRVSRYLRRNRKAGGSHQVRRRASTALPSYQRGGRVAYPAFKEIAPRMTSLWVQLVVKTYMDAAEGKGG